jgi:ATP-binding cassette subfamily B protein RaxB
LQSLSITRVVIAHRRETVAMVSRIIHLKDGQVTEDIRLDTAEVA